MAAKGDFAKVAETIKNFGWDSIRLNSKEMFSGAAKNYKTTNGGVLAVGFNMFEAFIVRDEQGVFEATDLEQSIFRNKDFNVNALYSITGAQVIADIPEDGEPTVGFDDDLIAELGIDTEEIKQDIKNRLTALRKLGATETRDFA